MVKKICITLTFILLFSACSANTPANIPEKKAGITISLINTSLGVVDNNNIDIQKFGYSVSLVNNDTEDLKIVTVVPEISESVRKYILTKDTDIQVNKIIPAGKSLGIKGEIIFDAKGLSKDQIAKLPFVKQLKIIEERIINKAF